METNDTQPFGNHIPAYLRDELMKAHQQKQVQDNPETDIQPTATDNPPAAETQPVVPAAQAETLHDPTSDPVNPPTESKTDPKADNDVNAWKGRLKKAQAERQELNARLIEQAEELAATQAKLKELEAAKTAEKSTALSPESDPLGLSDDELEEIRLINPTLSARLEAMNKQGAAAQAKNAPTAPPEQTTTTPTNAPPAAAQPQSERDRIWYAELQREIPEIQGLLGDPQFLAFAQGKTDWTGATGLDLISQAGTAKDVRLIPAIRSLMDEFAQSKTVTQTATAAPQKGATVKPKATAPKTMTPKDYAHMEMLSRMGKTTELKEFLAKFKQ